MKLGTLIAITEKSIPCALYMTTGTNGYRYNFKTDSWDKTPLIREKVTTVRALRDHPMYKNIIRHTLVTFAIQKTDRLTGFTDEEKKEIPKVLCISIAKEGRTTLR